MKCIKIKDYTRKDGTLVTGYERCYDPAEIANEIKSKSKEVAKGFGEKIKDAVSKNKSAIDVLRQDKKIITNPAQKNQFILPNKGTISLAESSKGVEVTSLSAFDKSTDTAKKIIDEINGKLGDSNLILNSPVADLEGVYEDIGFRKSDDGGAMEATAIKEIQEDIGLTEEEKKAEAEKLLADKAPYTRLDVKGDEPIKAGFPLPTILESGLHGVTNYQENESLDMLKEFAPPTYVTEVRKALAPTVTTRDNSTYSDPETDSIFIVDNTVTDKAKAKYRKKVGNSKMKNIKKEEFLEFVSRTEGRVIPTSDIDEAKSVMTNSGFYERMTSEEFDNLPTKEQVKVAESGLSEYKKRIKSNLEDIYNAWDDDLVKISADWYTGANRIANNLAGRYGLTVEQTSGALAALSPQTDWFLNIAAAERAMDVYFKNPVIAEDLFTEMGKHNRAKTLTKHFGEIHKGIVGKKLSDIKNIRHKALALIAYDIVNNDSSYNVVGPEGVTLTKALTTKGNEKTFYFKTATNLEKALSIIEDGSPQNISENIGSENKVRNFYNNIVSPFAKHKAVTIDTHAMGTMFMNAVSSNTAEKYGLFSSNPKVGFSISYAIAKEAYQEKAEELGLEPRELQSIVWEGIRLIFPETGKSKARVKVNRYLSQMKKDGSNQKELVKKILDDFGFQAPSWAIFL